MHDSAVFNVEPLSHLLVHAERRAKRDNSCLPVTLKHSISKSLSGVIYTHTHTSAIPDAPSSSLFLGLSACGVSCWLGNAS